MSFKSLPVNLFVFQNFTEGYVNHMFRFSLKSDPQHENALVIRIFGTFKMNNEDVSFGTDCQVMAMQMAHSVGIAESVYAIFKNGIVYRYAPGRTLTAEDLRNPSVIQ